MIANLLRKSAWFLLLLAGALGCLVVFRSVKIEREAMSLVLYGVFITLFVIVAGAVALFPNKGRQGYLLLLLPLLFILGYVDQKLWDAVIKQNFSEFYRNDFMLLYPTIVLSLCAAFRLGGGKPGTALKIAVFGIILLFSGYLDIMYFVINGLPLTFDANFAPHVQMVIGHVPSPVEMALFLVAHAVLIAGAALLPLDAWAARLGLE